MFFATSGRTQQKTKAVHYILLRPEGLRKMFSTAVQKCLFAYILRSQMWCQNVFWQSIAFWQRNATMALRAIAAGHRFFYFLKRKRNFFSKLIQNSFYKNIIFFVIIIIKYKSWGCSSTVRAPPCHGGSCGFESRQSRFIFYLL